MRARPLFILCTAVGTLTFTTTQRGVTTDRPAEGAFIHLTLREWLEGEEVFDDVAVHVVLDRAP